MSEITGGNSTAPGSLFYPQIMQIAAWYAAPGATPPERRYGTCHVKEKFAKVITASYDAMRFPAKHPFALDRPLRNPNANNPGHGEGASNPVYKDIWDEMLIRLNPQF